MDTDPLSAPNKAALHKKTNKPPFDDKPKSKSCINANFGINLVMCVVCIVSVSFTVYSSFQDSDLRSRLSSLERRVAYLEEKPQEMNSKSMHRLLTSLRYRREVVEHLKRRVTRDLAALRQPAEDETIRTTRDAPECICPAGKRPLPLRSRETRVRIVSQVHLQLQR